MRILQLEKILSPALGNQIPIVLGIDANGVVGSVVSGSVGPVSVSTESHNGVLLRSIRQAYKLKLVNTFNDGAPTWAISTGDERRIDYIAVSPSHFDTGCCWVVRFMGVAPGGRDDHWVVSRCAWTDATPRNCVGTVLGTSLVAQSVDPAFSPVSLTQRVEGGPEW